MKKLTYLFLALLIVACSSDDGSEQQTFLEKYDGIVWETSPESDVEYIQRFMFSNNPKSIISYFEEQTGEASCDTILLDIYEIFDNSNNIFSYGYDGVIITTVTVSSDGNLLTYNSYDDGICNKTNLTEPCN